MRNAFKLISAIVICELAGIIGSFFTTPAIPTWYATLTRPALNPPSWIFGPVWTVLYVLMGISLFLVWNRAIQGKEGEKKTAIVLFGAQLILNALWSILFFGLHSAMAAFVEMIFLWLAILATMIAFARISKPAALLLAPYIIWVSFAAYLNFAIWSLN
ncbi:MAG: TspO/MBR family protein [Parcubacteria group bacterium]